MTVQNLKLRVPIRFPTSVSGSGPVTITKQNGAWSVGIAISSVANLSSITDTANTILLAQSLIDGSYSYITIDTLAEASTDTNANLESLSGLTLAADKVVYSTDVGTLALADFTSAGRDMVAAADAAAQATLLPAVTISGHDVKGGDTLDLAQADITGLTTADTPTFVGLGGNPITTTQAASDNSTKIATTAWGNAFLTAQIGVSVQAFDADLSAIAALASTGISVRTASNSWAQRTITAGAGIGVTNGDGVSGNPTVAIGQSLITQTLLNSMSAARNAAVATFYGMAFADSFGATTYYDSGNSSGVDSGTAGLLKPSANSQISQASGTRIGSMTGGGSLIAAFDGTTSQAAAACAQTTAVSTSGYNNTVGKDWGAGNAFIVNEVKLWAPSDTAMLAAGGGSTVKIQGSNDNSAWTDLLTSGTILATAASTADLNSGIVTTTAYRYHRVNINGNGTNFAQIAEVQFFVVAANATIRSTAIATQSVPTAISVIARIKHVDTAVAGTDYNLFVSRDGGTTFSSALTLTDSFTDPTDSAHVIVAAECSVTGQPSGSSVVLKMTTTNNKNVELRDWGFSAR